MSANWVNRLALLLLSFCHISTAQQITLLTEEYPPYNYQLDNEITGINTEILAKACQLANLECHFELITWTRAFGLAQKNSNYGLFSTARVPEREDLFQWIGPLETSSVALYKLKTRTDINEHNIREYTIGVIRGSVALHVLQSHGWKEDDNIVEFSTVEEFYKPFFKGRYDLLPGSRLSLPFILDYYGYDVSMLAEVYDFGEVPYQHYLGMSHATDKITVNALQTAINKLRNDGWIMKLRKSYEDKFQVN